MAGIPQKTSDSEHFHHAPEQTELEKAVNRGLTAIEPFTNQIMIVSLAVTIVLAGAILWYRNAGSHQVAGWDEFALCRAPDDYAALAEKFPKTSVGNWSLLEAARGFMTEGLSQALVNKDASQERLNKAKSSYQTLLNSKVPSELREEALYGMATCLEALSDGDTAPAIDAYETLLQEFPESQHRLWAQERIDALKSKNAQEFYTWFHKQDPKPADRPQPNDVSGETSQEPAMSGLKLPFGEAGSTSNKPEDFQKPELYQNLPFEGESGTGKAKEGASSPPVPPKVEMPKPAGEKAPEFPEGAKPATEVPAKPPAEKPVPPEPKSEASPKTGSEAQKADPEAKPAPASKPAGSAGQ
jgi:hypothetical protein